MLKRYNTLAIEKNKNVKKNVIQHIVKELKNDFRFQLSKISFRIKIILNGCLNLRTSMKSIKKVKDYEIVIYTFGKSGSSSVYYTLMSKLPFKKIFHLHFLSDYWIKEVFPGTPHERNIHKAEAYFQHLKKRSNKKIKYITLVREPVGRDISGFFQNYRLTGEKFDKKDLESIRKIISDKGHDLAINWFDTDFFNYTGFNIYSNKFDRKKGFEIYKIDKDSEVLVILTHRLTEVFKKAISEFLNLEIGNLINFNKSSDKKDGQLVQQLKNYYFESDEKIDKVYSSKFVEHFFSKNEIETYKQKWKKNIDLKSKK